MITNHARISIRRRNKIKRGMIGPHTCATGGGDDAPEPLAPDPSDAGALYGMTVYPKNNLPKGRFNAAGTWRPSVSISLVTIFGLLQYARTSENRRHRKTRQSPEPREFENYFTATHSVR